VKQNRWSDLILLLDAANMPFDEGLTDAEVLHAERKYDLHFPPDLREFLQTVLPRGYPLYPDWRSGEEEWMRSMLRQPLDGILFDVEHNDFWLPEWGARPIRFGAARMIVEKYVNQAPRLIPIYTHRMMPDRPQQDGNPVFSVHQTDIVHYGFDLDDYLRHEFRLPDRKPWPAEIHAIEFWDVDRWQELRWGPVPIEPPTSQE
jgi:hypothetical protein